MKNRSVSSLLYATLVDMGGLPVRQPFPTQRIDQIDPFILLHHADVKAPAHVLPDHAGVGPHPHRGFSPVTFIFKGGVHHRDSRGNDSVIYAGGAQWMNAGMGIIHSERPPLDIHEMVFRLTGDSELKASTLQPWVLEQVVDGVVQFQRRRIEQRPAGVVLVGQPEIAHDGAVEDAVLAVVGAVAELVDQDSEQG